MPDRTPRLSSGRLRMLPLAVQDARELAAALADAALYEHIGGEPPTVREMTTRIARYLEGPGSPGEAWHNWAIRLADGTIVGHLQATVIASGRRADIAWIVGRPWQGRGYATEAAIALVRWLESIGVSSVTAHVHADNVASARVAERAGLERTNVVEGGEVVWRRTVRGKAHR